MAILIPKDLSGHHCTPETASFFRILRKLSDDFTVRFSLGSDSSRPHFFVLYQDRFAFLIQVAETSQHLAESAIQSDFLANREQLAPDALGAAEAGFLADFASSIEDTFGALAPGGLPVRKLVVFPDVLHQTIDEVVLQRSESTEVRFLGLRQLPSTEFGRRLQSLAGAALPEPALIHLRAAFDPGTVVPTSFSPLAVRERDNSATLTKLLLDLDQEWCVKNDLHLPSEQDRLARHTGYKTQLVTGVAGCGKSLVLLYRALLSARLNPGARVLVLTHNRPLRSELERRFHILSEQRLRIDWLTFFGWARRSLADDWPENILFPGESEEIIADLLTGHDKLTGSRPEYLLDEINWIKDLNLRTWKEYDAADRKGRGRGINRRAVWTLLADYQEHLRDQDTIDWSGVAMRFHRQAIVEKRFRFPHYDFIFVDEAQFFAKSWFDIVRAALKPGGHLFLAADPTQGFLRRRQSWLTSGIDVRGRTTRLNQPYRNSRAILLFAASFYRARAELSPESHHEEELNVPTAEQIATIDSVGRLPSIITATSDSDELTRACNELQALRRQDPSGGRALVIHSERLSSNFVHQRLAESLGGEAPSFTTRGTVDSRPERSASIPPSTQPPASSLPLSSSSASTRFSKPRTTPASLPRSAPNSSATTPANSTWRSPAPASASSSSANGMKRRPSSGRWSRLDRPNRGPSGWPSRVPEYRAWWLRSPVDAPVPGGFRR